MQEEMLIANWEFYKQQVLKVRPEAATLLALLEEETLDDYHNAILCPASTKTDYAGCYSGGLIQQLVRVCSLMFKLRITYGLNKQVQDKELVTVGLLHDIGKVGLPTPKVQGYHYQGWINYYVDSKDAWRKDKFGQMYVVNEALSFVSPQTLSLKLLSDYGIKLDISEWHAISSLRPDRDEVSYVKDNEPPLAMLLKHAVAGASYAAKDQMYVQSIVPK